MRTYEKSFLTIKYFKQLGLISIVSNIQIEIFMMWNMYIFFFGLNSKFDIAYEEKKKTVNRSMNEYIIDLNESQLISQTTIIKKIHLI